MFEALPKDADLPQAIETPAALTSVDGLAQLRSTSRKAPWSIRRPTAGRTAPSQRRVPRASQAQPLDDIVFALFLDKFGFIVVHVFEPEGRQTPEDFKSSASAIPPPGQRPKIKLKINM